MLFKSLATATLLASSAFAFPKVTKSEFERIVAEAEKASGKPEIRDGQVGRIIKFDPPMSFQGTKAIPGI